MQKGFLFYPGSLFYFKQKVNYLLITTRSTFLLP
jgi:hypothetical protein